MLCLSGFELYSRWVPLKRDECVTYLVLLALVKQARQMSNRVE